MSKKDVELPASRVVGEGVSQPSDAEVICAWMEPKPTLPDYWTGTERSPSRWWILVGTNGGGMAWLPITLNLGALWVAENRLTDERQWEYIEALRENRNAPTWGFLHATAEQKIKALALVLRNTPTQLPRPAADAPSPDSKG